MDGANGICDSCGAADVVLQSVHRWYPTPETHEHQPAGRIVDEGERWCFVCRTHYPHEQI